MSNKFSAVGLQKRWMPVLFALFCMAAISVMLESESRVNIEDESSRMTERKTCGEICRLRNLIARTKKRVDERADLELRKLV
jgi:hypothetical protein